MTESPRARRERAVREVMEANGGEIPVHSLLDWEIANPEEPMADPLIDRKRLVSIIFWGGDQEDTADRVLDYLQEVLTPEALDPDQYDTDGADLHRRIFGETE